MGAWGLGDGVKEIAHIRSRRMKEIWGQLIGVDKN